MSVRSRAVNHDESGRDVLINLAFIKSLNGLFYFAMDYVAELEDAVSAILVRSPALAAAARQRYPATKIRVLGGMRASLEILAASRRGEAVFTPSSHPIPWCSRQLVVVHDTFPFEGGIGRLKAALFFMSMRTSRAMAGCINESDARAFLLQGGLKPTRILLSPNRMLPPQSVPMKGELVLSGPPIVGLFGTDSTKKDYEKLFTEIKAHPVHLRPKFRLYGQRNDYIDNILTRFSDLDIELTNSKEIGLEQFVRSVDLVASAATREGFSRPIALALSLGIPCWVVDAPVYREFYGGAAIFHASVESLAQALSGMTESAVLMRPAFTLPIVLEQRFQDCIIWLKAQDVRS